MSEIFVSDVRHVSELIATCSDFLGRGRPSSSKVVQCACSKPPVHVVANYRLPKWPWAWPWMTWDPSLGSSVNKTLSGARTWTRARMLGQCKCKCALTFQYIHKMTLASVLFWADLSSGPPPVFDFNSSPIAALWKIPLGYGILKSCSPQGYWKFPFSSISLKYMGQVTELWLSCYLVLLSIDSKTR